MSSVPVLVLVGAKWEEAFLEFWAFFAARPWGCTFI
jgi:hypothetical protein